MPTNQKATDGLLQGDGLLLLGSLRGDEVEELECRVTDAVDAGVQKADEVLAELESCRKSGDFGKHGRTRWVVKAGHKLTQRDIDTLFTLGVA